MMREVIEVNVLGALWSMQHAIRRMSKKHGGAGGSIVLLSSVAADIGGPNEYVWYAASKGAVESITYGLSKELAGSGVDATVICPSAVTGVGMWARVSDQLTPNRLVESSAVTPDAVAAAVVRALEQRPRRILVGSPLVRAGALLSALSPRLDALTDRISRIDSVYRERIRTDRDNRL